MLYLAANHIADPPGAVSLGTVPRSLYPSAPVDATLRAQHYDAVTADLRETLPSQSSAGGEQPKFLVRVGDDDQSCQHLLVKFCPPHGTPFGERWRSLLHLEALALNTLKAHGISVAASKIITSETRSYPEFRRFDRIGREGKRHVVAIDALHEEFVKTPRRNWVHTCEALVAKKLLSRDDLEKVARIYAFGQFIGSSDMHFGNLSFYVDDVVRPSFKLAPVYDMLPMMWRPITHSGELDATAVRRQPQHPGYRDAYADARRWAILFWEAAAGLDMLEASLRQCCDASAARLREG